MNGWDDIADDDWGHPVECVVGWLIIIGTEADDGRYILKTMWCDRKGKLRQQEQEISQDLRMPNFIHHATMEKLQQVLAVLSIANVGDPVIGVGQKVADDVYWVEKGYEKTLGL